MTLVAFILDSETKNWGYPKKHTVYTFRVTTTDGDRERQRIKMLVKKVGGGKFRS